jgi:AmmeMemoRadiSam system protein B
MDWRIPLPRIRDLNPVPAVHNRQQVYYLQDPLQLAKSSILIPQEMGALFMLCDGTRTLQSIQTSLLSIFGIRTSQDELKQLFLALDEAFLLDNRRYQQAFSEAREAYRTGPHRVAAHAGVSYPSDPEELVNMLNGFQPEEDYGGIGEGVRGVISPHIDFARGGLTYAATWHSLNEHMNDVELVIIFGTDHHGNGEFFSITRQNYSTPFGTLPTFQAGIDLLVDTLGEESAFEGELRHRTEHSIEFTAVWLQYILGGEKLPILPILCDALPVDGEDEASQPGSDDRLDYALDGLRELMQQKNTIVIAAGDLSHVGPAFGGQKVQGDALEELRKQDFTYIESLREGDAAEFHRLIIKSSNHTNICGTAPFMHTLNLLKPTRGRLLDYRQCPADTDETSWVSICGMHLD